MKQVYEEKELCCGCGACKNICPQSAITMLPDKEGFIYPSIDERKCNNCNLCKVICNFHIGPENMNGLCEQKSFAAKIKNKEELKKSRSGGVFFALSKKIIEKKGIVYGAAFDEKLNVKHIRIESAQEIEKLQGSKYVQSSIENIYTKVEEDIKSNKIVMFSGTPCQVSAIKTYLMKKKLNCTNLLLIDISCYSVPSPLVFRDYLNYLERKNKQEVIKFDFRDKEFGWDSSWESYWFKDGRKLSSQIYTSLFYSRFIMRPSCAKCFFSSRKRIGDLTIADGWGIKEESPDFDENLGVSLILINNNKGNQYWQMILDDIDFFETKYGCLEKNHAEMYAPTRESDMRTDFWEDYLKISFEKILEKYVYHISWRTRIMKRIKRILR